MCHPQDELKEALSRESALQGELVGAREGMIRLQSMIGDMNKANNELMRDMATLESSLRTKERSSSSAEAKAQEAERALVSNREGIRSRRAVGLPIALQAVLRPRRSRRWWGHWAVIASWPFPGSKGRIHPCHPCHPWGP